MSSKKEEGFSGAFMDPISGKMEHQWRIQPAERETWVGLFAKEAPDGFGWSRDHARVQLDQTLNQVWHMYKQAQEDVEPSEIWSVTSLFMLDVLSRSAAGKPNFDPSHSLAPYVTISVRRKLAKSIGGSACFGKNEPQDRSSRALRAIAAQAVSISQMDSMDVLDSQVEDHYRDSLGLSLQDPATVLLSHELSRLFGDLVAQFREAIPVLACRMEGRGVREYPEFRDACRRRYFLERWRETGKAIPWIAAEAGRRDARKLALLGNAKEGKTLRARNLKAGMVAWRRAGHRAFCLERQAVLCDLVEGWKGGPPKTFGAMQAQWAADLSAACTCKAGKCQRCAGYGLGHDEM